MSTRLYTARLELKAFQFQDASSFFELLLSNEDRLKESFPLLLNSCPDLRSTQAFFNQLTMQWTRREKFSYGIYDRTSKALIGYIFIKSIDWNTPKCEIGYFLDGAVERKGFMTEALEAIVEHCFNNLKMLKLFLRIIPTNLASKRVAIKAGFLWEARLQKDFRTHTGQLVDVEYFVRFN